MFIIWDRIYGKFEFLKIPLAQISRKFHTSSKCSVTLHPTSRSPNKNGWSDTLHHRDQIGISQSAWSLSHCWILLYYGVYMQSKWWISQCYLFHILDFSWFNLGDAVIAVWLVQKLSWTWNRVCFYFTLRTLFQFRPIYNIPKLLQPELFFVIYKYLCKMLWYFRNICWSRLDKWTNRIWFSCWYRIDVQHRVFRCC